MFTHLHVHTEYSLLDGLCRINQVIAKAKSFGMTSLAITDHGSMYGVIDFYLAAREAKIKPIIGCEVYVAPGDRRSKNVNDKNPISSHSLGPKSNRLPQLNSTGHQITPGRFLL